MPTTQTALGSDLRNAMLSEHASMERRLERLVASAHMNDWERLRAAWSELEQDLRAHLQGEEEFMLPKFERCDAAGASHIRDEHGQIREQLEALGVELDLHALRDATVEKFVARLREHAAREEQALYAWAQTSLSEQEKSSLLSRLKTRLRALTEV
jgi:hemerythrin-like domain-containing protein